MAIDATDTPEGCVQALIEACRQLAIERMTLQSLVPVEGPGWLAKYNQELAESQRMLEPIFHRLAEDARERRWTHLQDGLRRELI